MTGAFFLLFAVLRADVRLAFGSCNSPLDVAAEVRPQPLWRPILDEKPAAFLWLGDAVYADGYYGPTMESPVDNLKRLYDAQKSHPSYVEVMKSGLPIFGIWDDHDFGQNNGDGSLPFKEESKELFLDFIDVPKDHPRREPGRGIYWREDIQEEGKSITILIVDTRFHSTAYLGEEEGDLFDEDQWKWLEGELSDGEGLGDLVVLASGGNVIATDNAGAMYPTDGPVRFPKTRTRLLKALLNCEKPVVIISGDQHFAELNSVECYTDSKKRVLYDLTSSGMTHPISDEGISFVMAFRTWPYRFRDEPSSYSISRNYGLVSLTNDGRVTIKAAGVSGPLFEKTLRLEDLVANPFSGDEPDSALRDPYPRPGDWRCYTPRDLGPFGKQRMRAVLWGRHNDKVVWLLESGPSAWEVVSGLGGFLVLGLLAARACGGKTKED